MMKPAETLAAIQTIARNKECPHEPLAVLKAIHADRRIHDAVWTALDHGYLHYDDMSSMVVRLVTAGKEMSMNTDDPAKAMTWMHESGIAECFFFGSWRIWRDENADEDALKHALYGVTRALHHRPEYSAARQLKVMLEAQLSGAPRQELPPLLMDQRGYVPDFVPLEGTALAVDNRWSN